jgi:Family of unknown function (DUF6263)
MKKIAFLLLPVLFLSGIVMIQSCQSAKSSTATKMLKFDFEKGKGYDYEMIMNMDQEIMGQKMQMDMTFYYSMLVTDDDGETKTISTTYERFKMNVGAGGMNIEIDSDKPLPDLGKGMGKEEGMKMLNGLLGAIKGRKFVMKVNREGKVTDVTGFKDMARSLVDSLKLDENEKAEMMKNFDKQFNEQSVKDQFERILYIFPNKEVKVGESWEKKSTSLGPMGGNYTSTYTVKDIEGDMVTLEEKSKIEGDNNGMAVKGDVSGTMIIDSKWGLVVNADQDMAMTFTKDGKTSNLKAKSKIKGKAR